MEEKDMPKNLMEDVYWTFSRGVFGNMAEFNEAVRQYQIAIKKKDDWQPNEKVFPPSSIQIYYDYWSANGEEEVEEIFRLESDNGEFLWRANCFLRSTMRSPKMFREAITYFLKV